MKQFSNDFLLGAATAAHQVEGNNKNSDFWVLEHLPHTTYKEPSLDACDHYNKYREDIKLMAKAGLNSYRFTIEWARIEPEKGKFDLDELNHYREVLECCHDFGITPIVTLHHFSSPKWLISEGGWESDKTIEYFENYSRFITAGLGQLIPYICTINEANMGIQISRLMKDFKDLKNDDNQEADVQTGLNLDRDAKMAEYFKASGEAFGIDPRKVSVFLAPRTENGDNIIMECHKKARAAIKEINPDIKVGITLSLYDYQVQPGGEELANQLQEEDFLHYLPAIEGDDFFGLQNYTRKICTSEGILKMPEGTRVTKMGYEFYPEALAGVIRFVAKHWDKPIMVTENGISTSDDADRVEFIERALAGVQECLNEGIDVIGYQHWSLMDNFEWQLGYEQTFGLIAVDRATQIRIPKESLSFLGSYKK